MNRVEVKKRKQRSDKKRDVKPCLTLGLKRSFSRLSYITEKYEKDLAEDMILYAINDSNIVSQFSPHFKHDVIINNTVYIGRLENSQIAKRDKEDTDRISTRLKAEDYEAVRALAFGLDCSVARVCALFIKACMQDINFVNSYVKKSLSNTLTDYQMRELRNLLKSANKDAEEEHYSWGALLSQIIDDSPIARIKDAVSIFISKRK